VNAVPATSGLAAYLAGERILAEAALERAVRVLWPVESGRLEQAIRYALAAGGKRLRPILCVAAYRACGGDAADAAAHDAAVPLELIHTYSLVQDDLPCMDDDALRRGRPTTHRVFGSGVATVAAAAMIPAAFVALDAAARALGVAGKRYAELVRTLARGSGAGGMVGGQVLDLEAEGRQPDLAALLAIHRHKTGALFAAATRMGAVLAGAPAPVITALTDYGHAFGLAFQVADDLLDETGATATLGKDAGRDRALHKATFPALLGLEGARIRADQAAARAERALRAEDIRDDILEELVRFAVDRDR
jgi:geranylgeranyl diphosphate synthase, type II